MENEKLKYSVTPGVKTSSDIELQERKKRSSTLKVNNADVVLKRHYLNLKNENLYNKHTRSPGKNLNLYGNKLSLQFNEISKKKENIIGGKVTKSGSQISSINVKYNK